MSELTEKLTQEKLGRICSNARVTKDGEEYPISCGKKYHGNGKTPKTHPCECIKPLPNTNPGYKLIKDCDDLENL